MVHAYVCMSHCDAGELTVNAATRGAYARVVGESSGVVRRGSSVNKFRCHCCP